MSSIQDLRLPDIQITAGNPGPAEVAAVIAACLLRARTEEASAEPLPRRAVWRRPAPVPRADRGQRWSHATGRLRSTERLTTWRSR